MLAVDARIGVARPPGASDPYAHMAIAPYPGHLVERDLLADGRVLTIRPIRPEDAEREQAFVRGLSPDAKRLRFLQSIKELSPALLAQFTQIDYAREMALVATVETDGAEEQVGVARYVINPDGRSCEFAIVVGDKLRGQGIGSRLMKALMEAARAQGLDDDHRHRPGGKRADAAIDARSRFLDPSIAGGFNPCRGRATALSRELRRAAIGTGGQRRSTIRQNASALRGEAPLGYKAVTGWSEVVHEILFRSSRVLRPFSPRCDGGRARRSGAGRLGIRAAECRRL